MLESLWNLKHVYDITMLFIWKCYVLEDTKHTSQFIVSIGSPFTTYNDDNNKTIEQNFSNLL